MSGLDYERIVLSGGPSASASRHGRRRALHPRTHNSPAIGEFELVQVADMYTFMNTAKSYVYMVAQSADRGETTRKAAGSILYSAEMATKLALDAIQLLGGNGYINDYPTGRLLQDARYEIGAGTSEIRRADRSRTVPEQVTTRESGSQCTTRGWRVSFEISEAMDGGEKHTWICS